MLPLPTFWLPLLPAHVEIAVVAAAHMLATDITKGRLDEDGRDGRLYLGERPGQGLQRLLHRRQLRGNRRGPAYAPTIAATSWAHICS